MSHTALRIPDFALDPCARDTSMVPEETGQHFGAGAQAPVTANKSAIVGLILFHKQKICISINLNNFIYSWRGASLVTR